MPMQKRLLESLKELLPKHQSPNKWLSEILGVDETTASRKFSGRLKLNADHLEQLLNAKPELLNALIPKSAENRIVTGEYVFFSDAKTIEKYLWKVKSVFELARDKGLTLHYFARDLPLLLFLAHPVIFNYKLCMWCNNMSIENLNNTNLELQALAQEVYEAYLEVNTDEIWYKHMVNNQLFQLDYYTGCGKMSGDQKKAILSAYQEIFDRTRKWATLGQKKAGKYSLGTSDYALLNNGGVLKGKGEPILLMTSLSSVFFISTNHSTTVKTFWEEFTFHKERSTPITRTNETQRFGFFNGLKSQLSI
jgi:hypothetical protein